VVDYYRNDIYSQQEGKTNLSHDGLNPAHVPYLWVNNSTLGEFCFTTIGRADIEGSKSDLPMNAWPPQASYPCGKNSRASALASVGMRGRQYVHHKKKVAETKHLFVCVMGKRKEDALI